MNIRAKIYGSSKPQEPIFRDKRPKGARPDALDSITVQRGEARRGNSRTEDRHRLSEEIVTITHDGVSHEAQLINVSGGGVMVRGPLELKLWDTIELHFGEHGTIECAVRWMRGDRIGLEFAHETRLDCSSDERASVLRDVIIRSFPDASFEEASDQQSMSPAVPVEQPGPVVADNSRSSASDHRRAARHPLIWTGTLHLGHWRAAVRVRNISSTGAMIECTESIDVGAEPVLDLGDETSLSGTVQWVVGAQVGLKFHTPFDMRLLARSKPEIAAAAAPSPPEKWKRPAYLEAGDEKAQAQSDPWDPRWKRLTVRQISHELHELEGFLKR
ncbi:MAG: PilZ domain-containing protein [Sphingomonas sp.]|nr:PilZ domain-containing protein [Sphingomonas sp.]